MDDREGADRWIRAHVPVSGPIETERERPWSTVLRVPLAPPRPVSAAHGVAWFKACSPVQAFEPRLTAELSARWPDRVAEVIAYDEPRACLLLADAGAPLRVRGNPPEAWLELLPLYGELQRGEAAHAAAHVAHGVPSLPVSALPGRLADLVGSDLPLDPDEVGRLRSFVSSFEKLCAELETAGLLATVQHDDLHMGNVYARGGRLRMDGSPAGFGRLRVLDWGDCSISHPFFSLVVTFRFLEEQTGLARDDPWFTRLRDAYLEPWGQGFDDAFELALRVGRVAHAIALTRHRSFLVDPYRSKFDVWFAHALRRALEVA